MEAKSSSKDARSSKVVRRRPSSRTLDRRLLIQALTGHAPGHLTSYSSGTGRLDPARVLALAHEVRAVVLASEASR